MYTESEICLESFEGIPSTTSIHMTTSTDNHTSLQTVRRVRVKDSLSVFGSAAHYSWPLSTVHDQPPWSACALRNQNTLEGLSLVTPPPTSTRYGSLVLCLMPEEPWSSRGHQHASSIDYGPISTPPPPSPPPSHVVVFIHREHREKKDSYLSVSEAVA